ncbi:sulfate/molybdate ABC transporter ATP-binding protein [Cohnella sp.]|uniref:sulfate/molybdate ABC transporter ATP-binding protein n=1 Tax=Cohnella sp. TaxID=1883426 RepID=UPI003563EF78
MLDVAFSKNLKDFSLSSTFSAGKEILGILGPSGCGKSLTLQCIAGLTVPDAGKIILNERVLFDSSQGIHVAPRFRKIGYVFQQYALFPHLTVAQNIAYGIGNVTRKERATYVGDMIERMQLTGLSDRYPSQLSGGQQQRVALARTLVTNPELLLLDEPFSAVDNHVKHILEQELLEIIRNNYSGTVLLVTHNIEEAFRLCNRIMMYANGRVVQIGSKEEIVHRPVNLTAARITGCKNLLPVIINSKDSYHWMVSTKGMQLRVKACETVTSKKIAGFSSHHVRLSTEPIQAVNSFKCRFLDVIEGIYSATVWVECLGNRIQVEVPLDEWKRTLINQPCNMYLQIPVEHIFLVDDDVLSQAEGNGEI